MYACMHLQVHVHCMFVILSNSIDHNTCSVYASGNTLHPTLPFQTLCPNKNTHTVSGIHTGLSIADSSGGGNQTCSSTLVLFSMDTLALKKFLGKGNQPQGWEIPVFPTL